MNYLKRFNYFLVIFVIAFFYLSCSSHQGPLFKMVTEVPADQSVIYLYRSEDKINTEFIIKYNDTEICIMENNGYFPYIVEKGKIELVSMVQFKMFATGILDQAMANSTQLVFEAKPGKTYFIECLADDLGGQELTLNVVPEKYGQNRIKECRLLQSIDKIR